MLRKYYCFQSTQENGSEDPSITVFVGNITDRASDAMIRQILMVSLFLNLDTPKRSLN